MNFVSIPQSSEFKSREAAGLHQRPQAVFLDCNLQALSHHWASLHSASGVLRPSPCTCSILTLCQPLLGLAFSLSLPVPLCALLQDFCHFPDPGFCRLGTCSNQIIVVVFLGGLTGGSRSILNIWIEEKAPRFSWKQRTDYRKIFIIW